MCYRNVRALLLLATIVACLNIESSYAQTCLTRFNDPFCRDCYPGPCFGNSFCASFCVSPPSAQSSGPGFSTHFQEGKFRVAEVFPNSPARLAGIKPGDVVERVDGELVPLCYGTLRDAQQHEYTLKRGDRSFTVRVASVSVFDLLAKAMRRGIVAVSYPSREIQVPQQPYLSGLITRFDSEGRTVEAVLPGSPAAEVGIEAGDRIVGVIDPLTKTTVEGLSDGSEYRRTVQLVVRGEGGSRIVNLRLRSATELLASVAASGNFEAIVATLNH
jgi:C-terminal processing protease CtpA/Prc